MKKNLLICLIITVVLLCSCNSSEKSDTPTENGNTTELFAMDTHMTLTAYGDNSQQALNSAKNKIENLNKTLSVGDKNSDVYKLNNSGKCKFSKETADIIKESKEICKNTDGAINPAVYTLMK